MSPRYETIEGPTSWGMHTSGGRTYDPLPCVESANSLQQSVAAAVARVVRVTPTPLTNSHQAGSGRFLLESIKASKK